MNPASASLPKTALPHNHDRSIAAAKREMISAFYRASPARVVEKHPWLSVTATASAAMTATVIAHAPFSRRLISGGLLQTFKSVMPLLQSLAMQKIAQYTSTTQQAAAAEPPPDINNAMG